MAEVKNSFLASKMNKDLDDRLIRSNEYRDAINVSVSNSEDGDIGALENILENSNVFPISLASAFKDTGKVIGYVTDASNDDIYLFYTNYTGTLSQHQADLPDNGTISAIIKYNPTSSELTKVVVQGKFLNFSELNPIYGINVVEDFLFWTDDRNQPRKINIRRAVADANHYNNEDSISIAKYAPYTAMDLYKSYSGTYKTTMKDVSSEFLPDGTTNNPDYNANYAGDSNFLEDKFVRFSYRIKYEDGEYSIMAPFTQIAFIPEQDGSFLAGDEDKTFQSTIVSFMENKVDQISLVINLPDIGNNLAANYKIKEIDILYKESDKFSISILDTIELSEIVSQSLATSVYEYSYQSRKPIKTLPQSQSTRVYDKTPVRALAQEISGNRVIYGNFVNKHTAPPHLNYQVSVSQKFSSGLQNNYSYVEYPEHTLKRNRNYQVGFVLSDRYGRQSDVILSSVVNNSVSNIFGASTFYLPYRPSAINPTTFLADVGNSIKIQLNETIKSVRSPLALNSATATGAPGLYNTTTNPTGWYSYKIVVKQTQQEYYNVYLPGFLKGDLGTGPETATHSVLIGDNINKVPRDLQEVGPNQTKYRSSEILFPVVENYHTSTVNWNQAFFPGNNKFNVTTVAPLKAIDDLGVGSNAATPIFENAEDPLVMRIGNNNGGLGATKEFMQPFLSIAETTPFVSNIDIYYETSTSGLISELNTLVLTGGGNPVIGLNIFDYNHSENQNWNGAGTATGAADSPYLTSEIVPTNILNQLLVNTQFVSLSVFDETGIDRTTQFDLEQQASDSKGYRLKLKDVSSQFYYGVNASTEESYTFTIGLRNVSDNTGATLSASVSNSNQITVAVVSGNDPFVGQVMGGAGIPTATITAINVSPESTAITLNIPVTLSINAAITFTAPVTLLTKTGSLKNIAPYVDSTTYTYPQSSTMTGNYANMDSRNGTVDVNKFTNDITYAWATDQPLFPSGLGTFAITSAGSSSVITLTRAGVGSVTMPLNQSGLISISSGSFNFASSFSLKVTITDAGGLVASHNILFDNVQATSGFHVTTSDWSSPTTGCGISCVINFTHSASATRDLPAVGDIIYQTGANAGSPAVWTNYKGMSVPYNGNASASLTVNGSGVVQAVSQCLTSFWGTNTIYQGKSSASAVCSQVGSSQAVLLYHDGNGAYPVADDTVYTDAAGTTKFSVANTSFAFYATFSVLGAASPNGGFYMPTINTGKVFSRFTCP